MNKKLEVPSRFSYQNEYWATIAGADIVEVIEEEDNSSGYDVDEKHLYKLANGRYAVVKEAGCSCYSLADADVNTFDTLKAAKAAYKLL